MTSPRRRAGRECGLRDIRSPRKSCPNSPGAPIAGEAFGFVRLSPATKAIAQSAGSIVEMVSPMPSLVGQANRLSRETRRARVLGRSRQFTTLTADSLSDASITRFVPRRWNAGAPHWDGPGRGQRSPVHFCERCAFSRHRELAVDLFTARRVTVSETPLTARNLPNRARKIKREV